MAGMINQLVDILNEQAERYTELLGLSREKKDVIVANDIEALTKITHLENLLISQNQRLERKRMDLVKDIALVVNASADTLTVRALADLMEGQQEQQQLMDVGARMRSVVDELAAVNELNAQLIDNALDYIDYSLNIIRSTVDQDPGFFNPNDIPARNDARIIDARH